MRWREQQVRSRDSQYTCSCRTYTAAARPAPGFHYQHRESRSPTRADSSAPSALLSPTTCACARARRRNALFAPGTTCNRVDPHQRNPSNRPVHSIGLYGLYRLWTMEPHHFTRLVGPPPQRFHECRSIVRSCRESWQVIPSYSVPHRTQPELFRILSGR